MIINVFKDYKLFDIGDLHNVNDLCSKISQVDNDVVLDLSKCLIDYPATSILVDNVLFALCKRKGNKSFQLVTHLNVNELLLLHWFLIGSQFFQIDVKLKDCTLLEIRKAISDILKPLEISFSIRVVNGKNVSLTHEYGN